jgi:hypothetical protein
MDRVEVVVALYPDRDCARSDFDELVRRIESGAVRSERRDVDRVCPRRSPSIPIYGKGLAGNFSSCALIATRTCGRGISSPTTE